MNRLGWHFSFGGRLRRGLPTSSRVVLAPRSAPLGPAGFQLNFSVDLAVIVETG